MLLSRLHYPIRNLGFGVRAGVWFQGCTIGCRGCVSRDTWAFDDSLSCDLSMVMDWLDGIDGPLDGVTVSGGEPTDQPEALRALLGALAPRRAEATDILMYSGRTDAQLRQGFPWLWDQVDVLITEPFDASQAGECALRGSANQRVHRLSDLANVRYPEDTFEQMYAPQRRQFGVHVDQQSIWMVGIPRPGDLSRMKRALNTRGVTLGGASWLS